MILAKLRNNPKEWIKDMFPILKWLPLYKLSNIPYDCIAGLTVALTLLPISLAYAQMASLRPEYGLYSSFLAQFIYIFMGTSKDAIIGPSAINSMLVGQFNSLNPMSSEGDNTYANILSFISGIILFLIGVLKLGFIVNLFSIPVVSGFTSAACFTIMASQLKSIFGLKKAPNDSPGTFVRQIKNVYDNWDKVHYMDIYFGVASLVFLIVVEYSHKVVLLLLKRCKEPSSPLGKRFRAISLEALRVFVASRNIMVFIPATGIAYYLVQLDPHYEKELTLVGHIKKGFPIPTFPRFVLYNVTGVPDDDISSMNLTGVIPLQTAQEIFTNLSVAIIIMPLMLMMELFAILKALARKNGYRLDPTNELIAVGIGNFLQSFIQAYPVTAATAKSALNDQCRVKSLLSTLISVVLIVIAIEELTGVFYFVPKAALGAILIAAAHHLFDYETIIHIYREYKPDLFMFFLTFLLCLFYDLAYGILISILINMITFLRPVVRMGFSVHKEPLDEIISGYHDPNMPQEYITVIQLSHGMQYPSVDKFIDRMTRLLSTSAHHFVIDCRFVTGVDFSGLQAWRLFLRMVYQKKKHVIFANLLESVRKQLEVVGLEHFRYVEDIENAVSEHVAQRESALQDAKLADYNVKSPQPRKSLHHMISVLTTDNFSRGPSRNNSISNASIGSKGVNNNSSTNEKRVSVLSETTEEQKTPDQKEQEARLMKILSFQPHYFHDIPVAADVEKEAAVRGHKKESKSDDEEDDDEVNDHVEFTSYPQLHFLHHRSHSLRSASRSSFDDPRAPIGFELGAIESRHNLEKLTEGEPVPPTFWAGKTAATVNQNSDSLPRRRKPAKSPRVNGAASLNRSHSHDFSAGIGAAETRRHNLVSTAMQTDDDTNDGKTITPNNDNDISSR